MAQVYAIASAKGGVGKTTTTANLGATLAGAGVSVVVIDGDIGMPNLGAALGIQDVETSLHDVLAGTADPQDAVYEGPEGLLVIPGNTTLDSFAAADPSRLKMVVEAFPDVDIILIDVGAGVSHETSVPLSVSDEVVLVSTAERDALADTEKTRQLAGRLNANIAGAVITRVEPGTPVSDTVSTHLQASILAMIPEDEVVKESVAASEPLATYAPYSAAAGAYRTLARELTDRKIPEPPEPPEVFTKTSAPVVTPSNTTEQTAEESVEAANKDNAEEEAELDMDAWASAAGATSRPTQTTSESAHTNAPTENTPATEAQQDATSTQTPAEPEKSAEEDVPEDAIPFHSRSEEEPAERMAQPEITDAETGEPHKDETAAESDSDRKKKRGFLSRLFR